MWSLLLKKKYPYPDSSLNKQIIVYKKKNIWQVAAFYAWMKWAQWQGISQVLKELSLYLESTSSTISHFEECNWSIQ